MRRPNVKTGRAVPDEPGAVPAGWKYALIALHTNRIADSAPPVTILPSGARVLRNLPIEVPAHWKEWLGSIRERALAEADLYLFITRSSMHPDILDEENAALSDMVHSLYYALLIGVENMHHGRAVRITGANRSGAVDIREVQEYEEVRRVLYCEAPVITADTLALVDGLTSSLRSLRVPGSHGRFWRVTDAFYRAVRDNHPGVRIHEFVRCVEGFLSPRKGRTREDFLQRTELFVGPGHAQSLGDVYDIRSGVEHMHGPLRFLPKRTRRQLGLLVLRRAIEIEALARHCIRRFLESPALWPYFDDEIAIGQFWEHRSEPDRRALWGAILDYDAATRTFADDRITDGDLGI